MANLLKRYTWDDVEIVESPNDSTDESIKKNKKALINSSHNTSSFTITKADADKRLVFGWALVSARRDGEKIIDSQGDIVEQDDLEEGAYEYVLNFRDAGEEHIGSLRKKARMVESVVFTEEKMRAMGIPPGTVPVGWWIGFYVDDDRTWELIKNGTYKMFSIEGKAMREPVKEPVTKSIAKSFSELVEKFNPYHDSKGRFATSSGYASFTFRTKDPAKQHMADMAVAREKERAAAIGANAKQQAEKRVTEAEGKMKALLKDGAEVKLTGMDPELAESAVSSLQAVLERYPTVKDAFGGFTTDEPEPGFFTENQGTYACYSPNTGKIHFNLNKYSDKDALEADYQEALSKKHFPEGTTSKSAVVHEMGHAIDRYVSLKTIDPFRVNWGDETVSRRIMNTDIRALRKKGTPMTGKSVRDSLSGYASKNPHEYFAEAFSEVMTSPTPRKTAQSIVKRMETYIKKAAKSD